MVRSIKMNFAGIFTRILKIKHRSNFVLVLNERKFSTELSYKIFESASSQVPILMAHGLMGNKTNFNSVAKKLNHITGRMVITYDAVNHGKSEHSDEMTVTSMSSDVIVLLDKLDIHQCALIGHSMGGKVAMHTALVKPDRIEKLVVVDTSPSPLTSKRMTGTTMQYVKAMKHVVWENNNTLAGARQHADFQLFDNNILNDSLRAFLVTNVHQVSTGKYNWRVNLDAIEHFIEKPFDSLKDMTPFPKDTLFLGGGNSEYITSEDYPFIRRLFPKSVISHIPNCGHWVHSDKPNEFISMVSAFLQPQSVSLF